jgi:hypothetical protein
VDVLSLGACAVDNRWPLPTKSDVARELEIEMLMMTAAILMVFWLFGMIGDVGGGLIHLLLVIVAVVLLLRLIQGRKPI